MGVLAAFGLGGQCRRVFGGGGRSQWATWACSAVRPVPFFLMVWNRCGYTFFGPGLDGHS